MSKISVKFRKNKDRPKGNVYIMYGHNQKTTYFSTNVSCPPDKFQNEYGSWIKSSYPGFSSSNKKIKKRLDEVDKALEKLGGSVNVKELKSYLKTGSESKSYSDMTIAELYEEYWQHMMHLKPSTRKAKRIFLHHWRSFDPKGLIILSNLSIESYNKLRKWMHTNEIGHGAEDRILKEFKACINWHYENQHIGTEQYTKIRPGAWRKQKSKKLVQINYLSSVELKLVINHKPTTNRLKRVRDLFIFQCLTGLRISDLKNITVSENFIRMKAKKTDELIQVPMNKIVRQILKNYGGKLPIISDQRYNDGIKDLLEEVGLNRKVDMPRYKYIKLNEDRKKKLKAWQKDKDYSFDSNSTKIPAPLFLESSSHLAVRTFITIAA